MTISQRFLDALPLPAILEALSFEEIRKAAIDELVRLDPEYTAILESDPAIKVIEACCYHILLLRIRVNDAVRANLLAFANGSDLDHLAAFYEVVRLAGEKDSPLRLRTIEAIQARSPGGSSFWYSAAARRADVRIRDVAVFREEFLPIIHVAVLSSENNGIPDQAMLDNVTAEVTSDRVRLVNDRVVVQAAVSNTINITADVWLLPDTPMSVFEGLAEILRKAWTTEAGIGFDFEPGWAEARMHVPGVKRVKVTSPSASQVVAPGNALALGDIVPTFKGRDY